METRTASSQDSLEMFMPSLHTILTCCVCVGLVKANQSPFPNGKSIPGPSVWIARWKGCVEGTPVGPLVTKDP